MTDVWTNMFRSIQAGFAAAGDPDAVNSIGEIMGLVASLFGMAGMRSYDKKQGTG